MYCYWDHLTMCVVDVAAHFANGICVGDTATPTAGPLRFHLELQSCRERWKFLVMLHMQALSVRILGVKL